jgi:hypothetical protein
MVFSLRLTVYGFSEGDLEGDNLSVSLKEGASSEGSLLIGWRDGYLLEGSCDLRIDEGETSDGCLLEIGFSEGYL